MSNMASSFSPRPTNLIILSKSLSRSQRSTSNKKKVNYGSICTSILSTRTKMFPSRSYSLEAATSMPFNQKTNYYKLVPYNKQPLRCSIFMMAMDDEIDQELVTKEAVDLDRIWDIPGMKKELERLIFRAHKKLMKGIARLNRSRAKAEELMINPDATVEELEECPNVVDMENEVELAQIRLKKLHSLRDLLQNVKGKKQSLSKEANHLAMELGVNDKTPGRPLRGPKKKKGPRTSEVAPRKPYRKYFSLNKTEIRVSRNF